MAALSSQMRNTPALGQRMPENGSSEETEEEEEEEIEEEEDSETYDDGDASKYSHHR